MGRDSGSEREVLDLGRVLLLVAAIFAIVVAIIYFSGPSNLQSVESVFQNSLTLPGLRAFLSLNQIQSFTVLIHGGSGPVGYFDLSVTNITDAQIKNSTLTNYTCSGQNCNFTIFLDNDNSTYVSGSLVMSSGNINSVYYVASDGSLRNVSELSSIGQGAWSHNSSSLNFTLAGADGFDYGIRDSAPGGSYWLNQNGTLYGKINISNDFIQVGMTETELKIYNSSRNVIFNTSFNDAVKIDNQNLISLYGSGTQNKTVYFFDWSSQSWKVWTRAAVNSTHGVPDWLDPRNKQAFKWMYSFKNDTNMTRPGVNLTFLMTAHDPFVRTFVDTQPITIQTVSKLVYSTPGTYDLTIPSGVTDITVKAWGAGGGGGYYTNQPSSLTHGGGAGGGIQGQEGLDFTYYGGYGGTQTAGGGSKTYPGGTAGGSGSALQGGAGSTTSSSAPSAAGGGGGYSGVFLSSVAQANAKIIAGGGGGSAAVYPGGGSGFAQASIPVSSGQIYKVVVGGGGGAGSASAGGSGGTNGGGSGSLYGGGGGGGGYYGGGGGGSACCGGSGGGGGGSGYVTGMNTINLIGGSGRTSPLANEPSNGAANSNDIDYISPKGAGGLSGNQSFSPQSGQSGLIVVYLQYYKQSNISIQFSLPENRTSVTTAEPGLVGYWNFNEGSGNVINDRSGNGNTGSWTNPASNVTFNTSCAFANTYCLDVHGTSQVVQVNDAPSLRLSQALSISVWVKSRSQKLSEIVTKSPGDAADNYRLAINCASTNCVPGGQEVYFDYGSGSQYVISSSTIPLNSWVHIVATVSAGGKGRLFFNGTEANYLAQATAPNPLPTGTDNLQIGGFNVYSRYCDCLIDDLRIYNRELNTSEIQQLYLTGLNQQKPGIYFTSNNASSEEVLFATTNFRNVNHTGFQIFSNQTNFFGFNYTFNSMQNQNFMFTLGTMGRMNTTVFSPQNNVTQFSGETLESVANSTMTYYDLTNSTYPQIIATGGTMAQAVVNGTLYQYHIFLSSDNFTVYSVKGNATFDALLVGGGGGATGYSTGGSGGGVVIATGIQAQIGVWNVTVGKGGEAVVDPYYGGNGTNSSLEAPLGTIKAYGGRGAVGWGVGMGDGNIRSGYGDLAGYSGEIHGNYSIGNYTGGVWTANGGGGGAGGPGYSAVAPKTGNGGDGFLVRGFEPIDYYYGGGGGGGAMNGYYTYTTAGDGGKGGGGSGGAGHYANGCGVSGVGDRSSRNPGETGYCNYAGNGGANTGGGAGGGWYDSTVAPGSGKGGSGIVIIRYRIASNNSWISSSITNGAQHTVSSSFNYDGGAAAIWKFDEGYGMYATDSSGNGNTGLINGPTWITNSSCKYGSCLVFDGNDYVYSVKNIPSFSKGTTIVWIKPNGTYTVDQYTGNQTIMGGAAATGADVSARHLIFANNSRCPSGDWGTIIANGATFQYVCSGQIYNSTNFPLGYWTQLAVSYDGSYVRFYKDGNLIKTAIQTVSGAGDAQPYSLGRPGGYLGNYFKGFIDEARIYPRALTDTEIREHYQQQVSKYYDDFGTAAYGKTYRYFGVEDSNTTLQPITPAGTVLHYRFNDNSTTVTTDSSGNGKNGTVSNAIWLSNSSCMQIFGGCVNFNGQGSNSYIKVGSDSGGLSDFAFMVGDGAKFTACSWIKVGRGGVLSGGASYAVLFSSWNNGASSDKGAGLSIGTLSSGKYNVRAHQVDGSSFYTDLTLPILNDDGRWHHLCWTHDETQVTNNHKFYVDGNLTTTANTNTANAVTTTSKALTIGAYGGTLNNNFNGTVDEVIIINRVLASDEIYQLYLGGVNRTVGGKWHRVASADGLQSVTFNLTDHDSFSQQDYDQRQLVLSTSSDSTPPTISIQSPGNSTYSDDVIWANVTLDEDGSVVMMSLDGGANVSLTNSSGNWNRLLSGLSNGLHIATFYANDTAGNDAFASIYFTVSLPNITLQINKTFNPLIPWWAEYVNISGYVSYENGTPFTGTIVVNETGPGKPESRICQRSLSSSGSFYCNFTSKYQVEDTMIWIYAKSGNKVVANTSDLLETKPNYGQRPVGSTPRSVLETPLTIQEPSSVIRTIITRLIIHRGVAS